MKHLKASDMNFLTDSLRLIVFAGALLICVPTHATTITQIDLNDFFADPTVFVAADGTSASFTEDPGLLSVLLSNDPGLGDPDIIVPQIGRLLSFNFDFVEGAGDNDEFGAFLINAGTGVSIGAGFEFFTQSSSLGTVSFDLSTLVGMTLGLQFQLSSLPGDDDLNSRLTVSNVRLEDPMPAPAPATAALIGLGLAGIGYQ